MKEEKTELEYSVRENSGRDGSILKESHPWLAQLAAAEKDEVDEVIVYTLDEIRNEVTGKNVSAVVAEIML